MWSLALLCVCVCVCVCFFFQLFNCAKVENSCWVKKNPKFFLKKNNRKKNTQALKETHFPKTFYFKKILKKGLKNSPNRK